MNMKIRKMQNAGPIIYEEDLIDKLEPYAAGIGLAGDVVGLGTAATGVGIPIGAAIAGFANIPNLIVDGYLTARDTWRSFNDNGNNLGSAVWNGGELILDAAGLKALQYINKAAKAGVASEKYLTSTEKALDSKPWKRVGTGHGRVRARQSANHKRKYNAKRNKALEESNVELAKRGVRPVQGSYYEKKLIEEMAKRGYGISANDAIKSANRTLRQNLGIISGISGGTNIYHLLPKRKSGGFIRKMQTAAGGSLQLTPEELKDLKWSKMTPELKREYRTNRAKAYLLSGPNITNFWEAFQTYIGNRDPENPHLNTGNVPNPGMKNPKDIIRLFRATGTSGKFKPSLDGTQEFAGKWFTDNIRKPLRYASSTFKKAKISKESNPVELQVVEIPASEINRYKASELLKGRTDIEYEPTEDFLIPLDYPRLKYPIEGLTGNLLLDMHLKLPIEKQGGKMNILELFKRGGQIRKMQTAAGGPLVNESTRVEKPIIVTSKKINKTQLSDDNLWEKTDNSKANVYPNLRNDKYIQEFFLYDYAPRLKRLNNFASQDYANAALNIYKNTQISIYNEDNNVGGYKTGGKREVYNNYFSNLFNLHRPLSIYLNEKFELNRPTLVHELTHAFRLGYLGITGDARFSSAKYPIYNMINKEIGNEYYGSGYSNSEKNILNNAYNMNGYEIGYDPLWEKGTTNTEVRFRLWKQLYDKLGRRPSLEETDKYIRTYDGEKLLEMIRDANAYGHTMYDNGMLTNLVKNALINVAQNNSNNTYLLDDQTYYAKQGGILEFLKNGSGIHIKKKNRGKFTSYCGGKVTDECIRKAKASGNPTLVKRATFADNARHFKHKEGGTIEKFENPSGPITAKLQAKSNLTRRKNPDWDNLDRGYRYLTEDMKLPHDLAVALMGNVVEESQGNYKAVLKNGGGRGLIQWDGRPAPNGRYNLWGSVWASVAKKANVYDPKTDTVKNYWAPWNGLKGDLVRLKFISAPLKLKALIYAESYLRPGKPRILDRLLSTMLLDSIYNPKIKNVVLKLEGGIIKAGDGDKLNGWQKIGNFLNSDTGKFIANTGMLLYKGINDSIKQADWMKLLREYIQKLKEAMINNVGDVSGMAKQLLALKKQLNPDLNFSLIDLANTIHLLETLKRLDNMDRANRWEANQLANLNVTYNAIKGESGYNEVLENQLGNIFKLATTV